MTTSSNAAEGGFDFIRKMWGNMGFNLPGVMTPTLDTEELERRITDLKAVEGWLKMNLNVLQMTIQGMEVQRATLLAVKAMSASASAASAAGGSTTSSAASSQTPDAGESAASVNPFANPALWTWPFAAATNASEKDTLAANSSKDAPPESAPEPSSKAPRKSTPKT